MTEGRHLDRAIGTGGTIRRAFARVFLDTRTGDSSHSMDRLLDAAGPVDPDFGALNVFFRLGFYIGDSTPFRQIRFRRHPLPDLTRLDLPEDAIIDGYIDLFRQAVNRSLHVSGNVPLRMGLTGGRDSRHILFQLMDLGHPPDACVTVDLPWAPQEAAVARRLAASCGVRHEAVPPSTGVSAEVEKNPLTNYCSWQHGWILGFRQQFRQGMHAFDGIGGDVLSESGIITPAMQDLLEQDRLDELADALVSKGKLFPRYLEALFPPRDDALARVRRELEQHLYAPNPLSSFFFWNRTCRDIAEAPFSVLADTGAVVHAPYLDDDLFRFLAGLDARRVIGRHLHTKAIQRRWPVLAEIPFASKATPSAERAYGYRRHDLWRALAMAKPLDARAAVLGQVFRSTAKGRYASDIPWICGRVAYLSQVMGKAVRLNPPAAAA